MKTIRIIILMSLLMCTYKCFAQQERQNKWGMTVSINDAHSQIAFPGEAGLDMDAEGNMINGGKRTNVSYSFSFIPKYYLNDQWIVRLELGLTRINLRSFDKTITSSGYYSLLNYPTTYDTITQWINRFVGGVQFNFFTTKKVESYGGANLQYIRYAAVKRGTYNEQRSVSTDTLVYRESDRRIIPGGFAAGIGIFAGFNVFLQKHLSFGAEFSSALLYYNIGGEASYRSSTQNLPNLATTTNYIYYESYKGARFTKIFSSFNLTVWF